jgi:predicted CoA-substrate-specific enzyme activase
MGVGALSLGIDVGSVSTNFAVANEAGELLARLYLPTGGRPLEALRAGFSELAAAFADADIRACGVTGSGRQLAAAVAGADIVKNEITAHAAAAVHARPDVRTILEIGGQDSKIIYIEDGCVTDFAMNTVCAAGTGSFLDRQAQRLGMPISEFGACALRSTSPVRIAGRCAVFAESDMISKQQAGHSTEDIVAGLCEALVRNYLNNLASHRRPEPPVLFQGGVAANAGLVAAVEKALGVPVIVPPHHDVMGAYGAALMAAEAAGAATRFAGFGCAADGLMAKGFECAGCANRCEVVALMRGDAPAAYWGDRCGKWSAKPVVGPASPVETVTVQTGA